MSQQLTILELSKKLGKILFQHKYRCVVAESCTGGSLAAAITDIPGSSQWFDRGFVTYSNESKTEVLSVPSHMIIEEGAVSEATALAMAHGALTASSADVSAAITGVAGPGGGRVDKPVGTVWIAWAGHMFPSHAQCYLFAGDREAIRHQAVRMALDGLIEVMKFTG
ncbi:MAG: CinA family protein [Legionellales bacterium]|nr:CinA family protein [Legionellales bacterium]